MSQDEIHSESDRSKEEFTIDPKTLMRLSSSKELHQRLLVLKPHSWWAIWITLFLFVIIILWMFVGTIPITVKGRGVFLVQDGLTLVRTENTGIVRKIRHVRGDHVRKGDVLIDLVDKESKIKIVSPDDGQIIRVLIDEGEKVSPGTPCIWVSHYEPGQNSNLVYGFVSPIEGKRVKVGTNVRIQVTAAKQQETVLGEIVDVSQFPVSPQYFESEIPNPNLIQYLFGGTPLAFLLTIQQVADSSQLSAEDSVFPGISPGTVGQISVIVDRIPPIYYVLPSFRFD